MLKNKFISTGLLSIALLGLPACSWLSKIKDGEGCSECTSCSATTDTKANQVLISIDGRPALIAKEFEDYLEQVAEENEQFKLMLQFMPDFKEQLFDMKKRSIIFSEWAKKNGVRNSKDYKDKERKYLDAIRESLDAREFIKQHNIEVNDADIQKYYEENKNKDPHIMIAGEGIKSLGISFSKQAAAEEFAKKVNAGNFEKLAKSKNLNVEDLGNVNKDSMTDERIREKIFNAKTYPTVLTVKDKNGKYWIILAKGKEAAQFRPLEQVKEVIKRSLSPKKMQEMLDLEVPKYEKEYKVTEDKKYFQDAKKELENKMMQVNPTAASNQSAQPEIK